MTRLESQAEPAELADLLPSPPARKMSEAEFVAWCEADAHLRAEWVDGEVVVMSPASTRHVELTVFLLRVIGDFVEAGNLGKVFCTDLAVRLPSIRRRRMPDVLFLAASRAHLLEPTHLEGAPDLAVEVVSAESEARDWREKYFEYESAGVREYWVIDPHSSRMEAYALNAGGKYERIAETAGRITSTVLPGLYIRPAWLWQDPLPAVRDVLRELGSA